jgi:hypothetical protein
MGREVHDVLAQVRLVEKRAHALLEPEGEDRRDERSAGCEGVWVELPHDVDDVFERPGHEHDVPAKHLGEGSDEGRVHSAALRFPKTGAMCQF